MALSFTSATGTTSATIPSHAAGDLIVAFAYRDGNTTRPTLPSGQNWTQLTSANGANSNSHTLAIKTATSSSEATGTFTNATSFIVVVVKTDISGGLLGYKNGAPGTASSSTLSFTGFTLDDPYSSSRVMLFAGHRSTNTTIDAAPANFTNITSVLDATDGAAAHRSTNLVSSFSTITQSVGGTSSGWRTHTLEVYDYAVPNEQDLDITLDDVTVSASQTLQHSQALTGTLDSVTVAVTQALTHPQSLAVTLDDVIFASSQTLTHGQELAIALDGISVLVNQAISTGVSQELDITLDDIAFTSNQTLRHTQSLATQLDDVVVSVSQTKRSPQSFAIVLDGISASATQTLTHNQVLNNSLDGVSFSATQGVTHSQALATSLADVVVLVNQVKIGVVFPEPEQVLAGVLYGPTGADFVGTYAEGNKIELETGRIFKPINSKVGFLI